MLQKSPDFGADLTRPDFPADFGRLGDAVDFLRTKVRSFFPSVRDLRRAAWTSISAECSKRDAVSFLLVLVDFSAIEVVHRPLLLPGTLAGRLGFAGPSGTSQPNKVG